MWPSTKALAFDMDGTLVDTVPLHDKAYRQVFERHGIDLDPSVTHGLSTTAAMELVVRTVRGRPMSVPVLVQEKQQTVRELLRSADDLAFPNVRETLGRLSERFRLGLCTAASSETVRLLRGSSLAGVPFSAVVTVDDGFAAKPDPAMYIELMNRLEVIPEETVVVEDSAVGLEAARRSGGTPIQIVWERTSQRTAETLVVGSLEELETLLW